MAVISEDVVRELAGFEGRGAPVTTCYLDVDGRRHRSHGDYEQKLTRLVRAAKPQANGTASVHADLQRIEDYVRAGIDRSRTRGLAIFSCSEADLFQVIPLPVPVRDQLVINHAPVVGQLEVAAEACTRFAVLLADRQRARVLVFELDELVASRELVDELPRDYDQRGEKERGDVDGHVEALARDHVRRCAELAFEVFKAGAFDCLSVAAPDEMARTLEDALHPYLKERLTGRLAVPPAAPLEEVRVAVRDAEVAAERSREAALVDRMRAAAGAGGKGVTGLEGTLAALGEHRVEVLLVSDGYQESGWRCPESGCLATVGPTSPVTGGRMDRVDDVVEAAIQEALAQGLRVEVCENADLDVAGRIGALLRY